MPHTRPSGIRARGVIVAIALIPAVAALMVWGNWVAGGIGMQDSLLSPAVAGITLLVALNAAVRRWRPLWALSAAELIAVYVVLAVAVALTVGCYGWGSPTASVITWPIWNASPGNEWQHLMWPSLPSWLTVADRDALAGFYLGDTSPYQLRILLAWASPALWWTAWVTALLWVSLCLSVIVRRRWSQQEQLPFPMAILPLQMTVPHSGLLTSPLFWLGAACSAGMGLLGLARMFLPSVPVIPTSANIGPYLANNPPWDALRTPFLSWEPWHLGLAYLMPVDMAFSLAVFNIFWRAEYLVSRLMGWTISAWGSFPYGDQQSVGGYLGLMASVVWLDRRYLAQVVRKALGMRSLADDADEPFSYRTAVFGAVGGLAFLWYFLARAGMSGSAAVMFLLLYLVVAMAISRMRAHLGPPSHDMWGAMPDFAMTQFPGTRGLGTRALGMLALLRPYLGEQGSNPMPAQLEALRMAERASVHPARLTWLMASAVPVTMLCYFWASIHFGYHLGAGTSRTDLNLMAVARYESELLESWLRTPGGANWSGVKAIGVGFGGTLALMALKLRFPTWPVHPVAFPLAFSWSTDFLMPAIIATGLVKALLLRYGGLSAHRRALPLFLGFIVGSATIGIVQSVALGILRARA